MMSTKFISSLALLLLLQGCDKPSPTYKADGPFPICYRTGNAYSQRQLIDRAVQSFIINYISPNCRKYKSVAEFYRVNSRCCGFTPNVAPFHEPLPRNEKFGTPVGTLRISYFCGFDNAGKYRDYDAVLTSCGLLLSVSEGNEKARIYYDYPPEQEPAF